MAALGSILSWDEADDNENVPNKSDDEIAAAENEQNHATSQSAPFDTVQFSSRNSGNANLNLVPNLNSNAMNQNVSSAHQNEISGGNGNGMFFQIPAIPTFQPQLGLMSQKPTQSPYVSRENGSHSDRQPHDSLNSNQEAASNQLQQIGMQINLSPEQQQFIAQNPQAFAQFLSSTVLQQNQQPQIVPGTLFPNGQVPQHIQQVQPQKQHSMGQQPASAYLSDSSSILHQFQLAQFQQQLQVAQAQQQQPVAAQSNLQIQSALQQLQAQFVQAQGSANSQLANNSKPSASGIVQQPTPNIEGSTGKTAASTTKPSISSNSGKKAKTSSAPLIRKTPVATQLKTKIPSKVTEVCMAGTVSASDTEGEASRKAKFDGGEEDMDLIDMDDADFMHLSPSEKLKASRDRNREHARNTRLRKKAYLEKLKHTVDELCRERDTLVSERAGAANLLAEMHNIRTEVLMSLFALRTSNERRRKLWSSILDESSFTCVMPVTPYRSFPASEVQVSKCLRTILGIDGMIADTASLHVLFDSLIDRTISPYGIIDFRYTLVTEEAVVAGSQMMARWVMTTTNAVQLGARMEVSKQGMLSCKFNSAHKIVGLEFMFDVMAFMLQLKQAAGSDGFTVIPNTVQTCQRSFDKPMVMTQSEPPYTIIQVNSLWEEMTGYSSDEVVGRLSCSVLQGANMDRVSLIKMMDEVRHKRPASALLVNRRKTGDSFTNYLVIYPLSTDSRVAYFLGLSIFWSACTPSNIENPSSSAIDAKQHLSIGMQGIVTSSHPQPFQATPVLSSVQYSNVGTVSNTCPPNILSQVPASEQSLCLHLGQSTTTSSFCNKLSQVKRTREEDSDCRL